MGSFFDQTLGQWELLIRIFCAAFCGGVIGYERSRRQKEAGTRTHIIVCLGAALMIIISKYGFFDVVVRDSVQVDASRIASNVVTGISFLGAGVIFVKGGSIKGLTTSAGLWATAGVGLAMGAGMYMVGGFSTFLIICIQLLLHKFNLSTENISSSEISLIVENNQEVIERIKKYMVDKDIYVMEFHEKRNPDGTLTIEAVVKHTQSTAVDDLMDFLSKHDEVKEINVTT